MRLVILLVLTVTFWPLGWWKVQDDRALWKAPSKPIYILKGLSEIGLCGIWGSSRLDPGIGVCGNMGT